MRTCAWLMCLTSLAAALGCSGKESPHPTPKIETACVSMGCTADVASGRAALERGDFAAARAAFECGDTREASFGAGLATLITALEGPSTTQVLADLGLPPFPAHDLVGPTGFFSLHASRWKGSGMIEMSATSGGTLPLTFERGQQLIGTSTYVRMRSTTMFASLSMQFGATPLSAGSTVQLGCQTSGFPPALWLSSEDLSCSTPSTCSTDGGTITIEAAGKAIGDKSEYTLHAVKLNCYSRTGGSLAATRLVDGTLTTVLASSTIDTSSLHPLLSDDEPFASIPPTTTLGQVASDVQGLGETLDRCACYFKAAGAGTPGPIFEIPATVFGGTPIPVTAADAKLLAGAAESIAGALQILRAYDLPMLISGILCGGSITCLSDQAATERFNGGLGRLLSPELVADARDRFIDASALGAQAFAELSEDSIILRTPDSAAALDRTRDYVQWAHDSLSGQNPPFPHVTPTLQIDLASPLSSPPDPSQIAYKPLAYDMGNVVVVDAFMRAAFPAWNNLQWTPAFWRQFQVASLPTPDRSALIGRRLEGYGLTAD